MSSPPLIGLCTALEHARWSVWAQEAVLLPRNYVDAVQRAGAIALLLPPDPRAVDDPDLLLDLIDGLMLAGGADMDPATYGAEPHAATVGSVPERDAFELALATRAMERDLPFLGTCRTTMDTRTTGARSARSTTPTTTCGSLPSRSSRASRRRASTRRSRTTIRASSGSATGSR
jgi:gamma-glutamyl-gamma-aminobutyrate hydrolase PuuD